MSTDLNDLAATFLRGTARSALPAPCSGPLGAALQAVQRPTPEETLLARAALSGLYAQAGRVPAKAQTPAPVFVATYADERPEVPEALLALFPALTQRPALLHQTLSLTAAAGLKLTAPQALPLLALTDGGSDAVSGPLWTLLDEHARWLARLNPAWKRHDPGTPPDSLRLTRLRRELVEAHALQPEAAAAQMLERWPRFRADERRAALGAAASSLHVADLPLLQLAMTDKLPDVRRQARLLQGHLPGEVQEQARAALKAALTFGRKGNLNLMDAAVKLPPALDDADLARDRSDSELRRVLGALPLDVTLKLLQGSGVTLNGLLKALHTAGHPGFSGLTEDLNWAAHAGAQLDTLVLPGVSLIGAFQFWPQQRIRERLWQALARLLLQPEPDQLLLVQVLWLFGALTQPLFTRPPFIQPPIIQPLPPAEVESEEPEQTRTGLLARLLSAPWKRPDARASSWPLALEQVAEHLLRGVGVNPRDAVQAQGSLLRVLAFHLDPLRAAPALPSFPAPPNRGEKPNQETLGLAERQEHEREQVRQLHAELLEVLALRRRVQDLLAEQA